MTITLELIHKLKEFRDVFGEYIPLIEVSEDQMTTDEIIRMIDRSIQDHRNYFNDIIHS